MSRTYKELKTLVTKNINNMVLKWEHGTKQTVQKERKVETNKQKEKQERKEEK